MSGSPVHDDRDIELDAEDEHRVHSVMLNLALRQLIADFATMNRTPKQAQEYIDNFRTMLNEFTDLANAEGAAIGRAWDREMRSFTNLLLNGISFAEDDKWVTKTKSCKN